MGSIPAGDGDSAMGGAGAGLVLLGQAAHSPYMDNRPLLMAGKREVLRYEAVYIVDDAETGEASEETIVTGQPQQPTNRQRRAES